MDSKVLPDPPEEYERVGWLVESFNILSDARQYTGIGMGGLFAQPISFSDIDKYAYRFGIRDNAEYLEFLKVIQSLDPVMREHINKRMNPPPKKKK